MRTKTEGRYIGALEGREKPQKFDLPLLLWLDLKDYDAPMDKLSEFADRTWYLEEDSCPAASVEVE